MMAPRPGGGRPRRTLPCALACFPAQPLRRLRPVLPHGAQGMARVWARGGRSAASYWTTTPVAGASRSGCPPAQTCMQTPPATCETWAHTSRQGMGWPATRQAAEQACSRQAARQAAGGAASPASRLADRFLWLPLPAPPAGHPECAGAGQGQQHSAGGLPVPVSRAPPPPPCPAAAVCLHGAAMCWNARAGRTPRPRELMDTAGTTPGCRRRPARAPASPSAARCLPPRPLQHLLHPHQQREGQVAAAAGGGLGGGGRL